MPSVLGNLATAGHRQIEPLSRRFIVRALAWTLLCGGAWVMAVHPSQRLTFSLAKRYHAALDRPVPLLFSEGLHPIWAASLFPPVVGLMFASHWLTWKQRCVRALVGSALLLQATVMIVIVLDSPYLPGGRIMRYIQYALENSALLILPIVIWVLLAEIPMRKPYNPPAAVGAVRRRADKPRCMRASRRRRSWPKTGWLIRGLAFVMAMTALTPALSFLHGGRIREDKARMGRELDKRRMPTALAIAERIVEHDPDDANMHLLHAVLLRGQSLHYLWIAQQAQLKDPRKAEESRSSAEASGRGAEDALRRACVLRNCSNQYGDLARSLLSH